jgi:hypothetical protein
MDVAAGHDTAKSGLLGIGLLLALRPLVHQVHVNTLILSNPTSFHLDRPTGLQNISIAQVRDLGSSSLWNNGRASHRVL